MSLKSRATRWGCEHEEEAGNEYEERMCKKHYDHSRSCGINVSDWCTMNQDESTDPKIAQIVYTRLFSLQEGGV